MFSHGGQTWEVNLGPRSKRGSLSGCRRLQGPQQHLQAASWKTRGPAPGAAPMGEPPFPCQDPPGHGEKGWGLSAEASFPARTPFGSACGFLQQKPGVGALAVFPRSLWTGVVEQTDTQAG